MVAAVGDRDLLTMIALTGMVDLHHHLLYGLDDGARDLETSVEMARMAAADGITHIVATPHASSSWVFDPELVAERLAILRQALAGEAIPLTLGSGCDFHLSYDNVQDAVAQPTKYTINATSYLLIELPDFGLSPNLGETLYQLRLSGMTPILTHPERNASLQRDPAPLTEWMRAGLLTQVTTSSVLGQMGKPAQRMADKLLADRWVHFLATDAHNLEARPPRMREARDRVAKRYGAEYAKRLSTTNPLAVFEGRPLPEQDEPLHLYDDEDRIDQPWWKRLLRR
jgi:protein-tyrosine phosphatase